MEERRLRARMLGEFTLELAGKRLEVRGRSRKMYLLLAHLIRERRRAVPYEELAELLWPGEEPDAGTWGALKSLLHRARNFLTGLDPQAGRFLLNRENVCRWDPAVPLTLDAEEFSALYAEGEGEEGARLAKWTRALALYRGDFLPGARGCPWAEEQREELRAFWRRMVEAVLPMLARAEEWERAAALAGEALVLEPEEEDLCRGRMEALLRLGRGREAVETYERFQDSLLARRGVLPSDGLRELCRMARNAPDPRVFTPADLPDRLREPPAAGALLCGFDFFRVLCFSLVRLAQRGGQPLHTALITLAGVGDAPLPRHSLERAMDHLQGVIVDNLRRGDAAARCSNSQFVLLLPQAGYHDAQTVCLRVCRAYARQFPHAPASPSFAVLPLV